MATADDPPGHAEYLWISGTGRADNAERRQLWIVEWCD